MRSTYSVRRYFPARIAYVWAMVFIGIVMYAMTWFVVARGLIAVIVAVEESYTFTSPWDATVILIKNVVAYHPIIAMVGWLIWGFLNSARREPRAYAEY